MDSLQLLCSQDWSVQRILATQLTLVQQPNGPNRRNNAVEVITSFCPAACNLFPSSQELDVGTNHTQWLTVAGSTGLAGNRQLNSFADEGDAKAESASTFHLRA